MIDHTPPHRRVWSGLAGGDAQSAQVGILGVPFDGGTSFRKGAAFAPARLREITPHIAPISEEGRRFDALRVMDYGDVLVDLDWLRYFTAVRSRAGAVLKHPFALFLGGDHSVTIPLFQAFSQVKGGSGLGVLHIDAHADLMDTFEGHRWSHACTARRVLEYPGVSPEHMVFVGLRSWLPQELEYLSEHHGIGVHRAIDVYRSGIQAVAEAVAGQLADVKALYVTLDIDVLDPAHAPGTGTPEAAGLTTRDVLELLRVVFERLPVQAMDIVEVSPPLDSSDITSLAALKIIYEVFGWLHG
jgi:agmatinase